MANSPYDLNQLKTKELDMNVFLEICRKSDKIEQECKEKYGDDWWEHYLDIVSPERHLDKHEKCINRGIYGGYVPLIMNNKDYAEYIENRLYEKLQRMFGGRWKDYVDHAPNDPEVNRALIEDAIKTGKWQELPKELHEEYHRQAGK